MDENDVPRLLLPFVHHLVVL